MTAETSDSALLRTIEREFEIQKEYIRHVSDMLKINVEIMLIRQSSESYSTLRTELERLRTRLDRLDYK